MRLPYQCAKMHSAFLKMITATKAQCSFAKLKRMVGEGGSSGIKVLVKNDARLPVPGITVTDQDGTVLGTTGGKDGQPDHTASAMQVNIV